MPKEFWAMRDEIDEDIIHFAELPATPENAMALLMSVKRLAKLVAEQRKALIEQELS